MFRFKLITCVREVLVEDLSELPALCREEEKINANGYAVYAEGYYNGRITAFSHGLVESEIMDTITSHL